jgi:hypothetical protein
MSVGESDAFGALSGLWLRSQAETESPRRNGERQGGKQRREAVLLSARSKSSKGAERSGESRRCPSESLSLRWHGCRGAGGPSGLTSRYDRNAVNLGSEIGLQHARRCRKPQSAVVVRNHESSARRITGWRLCAAKQKPRCSATKSGWLQVEGDLERGRRHEFGREAIHTRSRI